MILWFADIDRISCMAMVDVPGHTVPGMVDPDTGGEQQVAIKVDLSKTRSFISLPVFEFQVSIPCKGELTHFTLGKIVILSSPALSNFLWHCCVVYTRRGPQILRYRGESSGASEARLLRMIAAAHSASGSGKQVWQLSH